MQDRFDHIEAALDRTAANLDRLNGIVATLAASIDTRFANIDARFANIDARFASQAKLIEEASASLQREMNDRFDRMEIATARNTKMLAGGSKTVAGLAQWAEKRDALDRKRDQEIRELRARLTKLERRLPRQAS